MEKFVKEGEEKPMVNYEVVGNAIRLSQTSIDKLPYNKEEYLSSVISCNFIVNR